MVGARTYHVVYIFITKGKNSTRNGKLELEVNAFLFLRIAFNAYIWGEREREIKNICVNFCLSF